MLKVLAEALRAGGKPADRVRRFAWIIDQIELPRHGDRGRPDPSRLGEWAEPAGDGPEIAELYLEKSRNQRERD